MPGFLISSHQVDKFPTFSEEKNCIFEEMIVDGFYICRNTLNKFLDDKLFFCNKEFVVIIEGYLLNKSVLKEKYCSSTTEEMVTNMILRNGKTFFSEFRGCFSGAVLYRKENEWIIFTNQFGDNPVFYYHDNEVFLAGSQIYYLICMCKKLNVNLTINEQAAYYMLTYGFMPDESTYAKEIKRLQAGEYLINKGILLNLYKYHRFVKNTQLLENYSEEMIIDELDRLFVQAIILEYEKDKEYDYNHLTDISGGLDSRIGVWVAHETGKRDLHCISYSKNNYLDEKIAKNITNFWKDELLFKSLDDGKYLYDIDEIVRMNGGLSFYAGITGGKRLLESLNMNRFGIEHTGMIGDVVVGSFFKTENDLNNFAITGMYSSILSMRLDNSPKKLSEKYSDYEFFLLYTRGFQGAANSHLIRKFYTEVGSPFMNVEFFQFCMNIPLTYRCNHKIYKKWLIEKYPDATKFQWEKTCAKITDNSVVTFIKKAYKRAPARIIRFITKKEYGQASMNPLGYFVKNNAVLQKYLDNYFTQNITKLPINISEQLLEDMKSLYSNGNEIEKTMVLTVVSSIKLYFGENYYEIND